MLISSAFKLKISKRKKEEKIYSSSSLIFASSPHYITHPKIPRVHQSTGRTSGYIHTYISTREVLQRFLEARTVSPLIELNVETFPPRAIFKPNARISTRARLRAICICGVRTLLSCYPLRVRFHRRLHKPRLEARARKRRAHASLCR